MTETTANGKTQNVIFRNFCCISVLSQSFFHFFFFAFCLLVCLCFWFCLSVWEKAQRDVAHFALMSDYTSHVSCELWADLDSQLWRSSPSPSCPSNWSKCLVVVSLRNELGFVFGQKMHRIRVSWQRKRQTAAGCTSFNANDLEKKDVKLKNQKRKRSLNVIEISLRKHLLQFVVQVKWCSNRRRQRQRRGGRNCGNLEIPG